MSLKETFYNWAKQYDAPEIQQDLNEQPATDPIRLGGPPVNQQLQRHKQRGPTGLSPELMKRMEQASDWHEWAFEGDWLMGGIMDYWGEQGPPWIEYRPGYNIGIFDIDGDGVIGVGDILQLLANNGGVTAAGG